MREERLVEELIDKEAARIVIAKARATGESESSIIGDAVRKAIA